MAPQHFNLSVAPFSGEVTDIHLVKAMQTLTHALLCVSFFPSALPVILHHICSATVWGGAVFSEMDHKREGGWCAAGAEGVEGEGRGRLPEGSALWLALSN